jgi:hypothetical protein
MKQIKQNISRRVSPDRRKFSYAAYLPERRSGEERRSGVDRRMEFESMAIYEGLQPDRRQGMEVQ